MDISQTYIVGGGITGLAVSKLIPESRVTLVEASRNLGGILRDLQYKDDQFFSGCQYMNANLSFFVNIGLKQEFYEFNHIYASYTDIFDTQTISDEFAGPVFEGEVLEIKSQGSPSIVSLSDRCDRYPHQIGVKLKDWFSYIGVDVNATHHSAVVGFQASRVYLKNDIAKVLALKQENQQVDMLFGLPRSVLGLTDVRAFLPVKGFSSVFDEIVNDNLSDINILTQTTVSCQKDDDKIVLKTKDKEIRPDLVIWTADPTKLLASVFDQKLDSLRFSAEFITGFLDDAVVSPFYVQVYSMRSRVMRVYLYNMSGRSCYTLEKAFDKQPTDEILDFSQKILDEFTDLKLGPAILRKRSTRYFAYSVKDFKTLGNLFEQNDVSNLIVPDYLSYGRDQKINSITAQLARVFDH